jgi:curved DNA-binding protein CbpA
MASPTSPADSGMASPTSDPTEATDHYAILELTPKATTDEIRAAYRRLRSVYFANDAKKYRALQAGFDCLMDPESRQAYDATYQPRAAAPSSLSSIGEVLDQGKHWRKDSAHGDDAVILEEEEEDEVMQEVRTDDPNWGLKRFQPAHESVLGSEPYLSYVPVPTRTLPTCGSPKYVGQFAVNAWPN